MSNNIPDRWKSIPLRSLTSKIGNGATPRGGERAYKESGIPLIRSMNVYCDGFRTDGLAYLDKEQAAALNGVTVRAGDVLLNITGASIGRVTQAPKEMDGARVNQHVCIIRPVKGIEPSFMARYFASPLMQAFIAGENYGVTRQALTKGMIENISFPVPPLEEQYLIVAKLDGLFDHSKSAREELSRIPSLVERYKQAILAAAFRGDLTVALRSDRRTSLISRSRTERGRPEERKDDAELSNRSDLPQTWKWATVESIGQVILGRQRSPDNHQGPNMRPYLRAANITWDGLDLSDVKKMNFDERDFNKFRLKPGDVLINEGSGSADEVGKPAIWNGEVKDCCFQNTLIAVRPHAEMSDFLYFVFLNAVMSGAFVDETRGVNIHHIGRAGLAKFPIPLPPMEEQHEIVRRLKTAFAKIEGLLKEALRATDLLIRLDNATLAKAFRGEFIEPQRTVDTKIAISQ